MNLHELNAKLQELGIPSCQYYLHGIYGSTDDEDKLSLLIKKGKRSIEYHIYYKERGEKHSVIILSSEHEACAYFLKRFTEKK